MSNGHELRKTLTFKISEAVCQAKNFTGSSYLKAHTGPDIEIRHYYWVLPTFVYRRRLDSECIRLDCGFVSMGSLPYVDISLFPANKILKWSPVYRNCLVSDGPSTFYTASESSASALTLNQSKSHSYLRDSCLDNLFAINRVILSRDPCNLES